MSCLKELKWFDCKDGTGADVTTIICEYDVYKYDDEIRRDKKDIIKSSDIDSWVVSYYNRQTEEPSKEALGFRTMEDAKKWAWGNYNMHMSKVIKEEYL